MASDPSILIDPIVGTLGGEEFTCDSRRLLKDGFAFTSLLAAYLPTLDKTGVPSITQPITPLKRPQAWWRAQCVFRGIDTFGSVEDIQRRLRRYDLTGDGMDPRIKAFEEEMLQRFRRENEQTKNDNREIVEEKGKKRPDGRVRGPPPKAGAVNGAAAVPKPEGYCQGEISHQERDQLAHSTPTILKSSQDWIVVGNRTGVLHKVHEKKPETKRKRPQEEKMERKIQEERRVEEERSVQEAWRIQERRRLQELTLQEQRRATLQVEGYAALLRQWNNSSDNEWDVTGIWDISCPDLDGGTATPCNLLLYFEDGEDPRTKHIWAGFNFLKYAGVLRLLKPGPKTEFLVPNTSLPSPERRRWEFQWRGEDTVEDMTLNTAEHNLGRLRFVGSAGLKMEGQLIGPDINAKFEGRKVGGGLGNATRDFSVLWAWESDTLP